MLRPIDESLFFITDSPLIDDRAGFDEQFNQLQVVVGDGQVQGARSYTQYNHMTIDDVI